jgi:hypothetical protein
MIGGPSRDRCAFRIAPAFAAPALAFGLHVSRT